MKIKHFCLILLAMFFICSSVYAIKPCNGLAGYKLGEKLNPDKALYAGSEGAAYEGEVSNLKLYRVSIIKPFMDFTQCVVVLTPNSNLIGAIFLYQEIKTNGEKTFDKVKTVVESHYEIGENNKEEPLSFVGKEIRYLFPNNRVMGLKYEVQLLGNNKLGLFVADEFILKIAQEEFNQNTIKNTNTSGLE